MKTNQRSQSKPHITAGLFGHGDVMDMVLRATVRGFRACIGHNDHSTMAQVLMAVFDAFETAGVPMEFLMCGVPGEDGEHVICVEELCFDGFDVWPKLAIETQVACSNAGSKVVWTQGPRTRVMLDDTPAWLMEQLAGDVSELMAHTIDRGTSHTRKTLRQGRL